MQRFQSVKDLFVFSCYTGLAYSDVMGLTAQNISIGIDRELWIVTSRKKTNQPLRVPLLPKAKDFIERYRINPKNGITDKVLPTISNQKLNSYLKEIAHLCGIEKALTFHLARHTFATTVTLTNGVPIETVSSQARCTNAGAFVPEVPKTYCGKVCCCEEQSPCETRQEG